MVDWSPGPTAPQGGVAVWAHIGGFVAGAVLVKLFENRQLVARRNEIRRLKVHAPLA
jgi:membrane associated rhomboid family serine protease